MQGVDFLTQKSLVELLYGFMDVELLEKRIVRYECSVLSSKMMYGRDKWFAV